MKIAVLSESPVDEAFIKIIVGAILKKQVENITTHSLQSRGWQALLQVTPAVIRNLYYKTEAEALAIVVDSDETLIHSQLHEQDEKTNSNCRLCGLRRIIKNTQDKITVMPNRAMIKTAVGLAVPAMEAWYRCGLDAQVNEATWVRASNEKKFPYTKQKLKIDAYGSDRAGISLMTRCAVEAANRLANDLTEIEKLFPGGFGSFARDVRGW